MGKTFLGEEAKQTGQANLMGPEQLQYLQSILGGLGPQALGAYQNLLGGYSEDLFQKGVVQPAMQNYEQQVLPAIQQRFVDANSGSSSALNQALTQSAGDLENTLAGQRLQLQQNASQNQLQVLAQLLGLTNARSFDPIVQGPSTGILPDLIKGGAAIGSAALMGSSKVIKRNIRDWKHGIDVVRNSNIKIYDYKEEAGGAKDCVGLIAEELPKELTGELNGRLGVDIYGLICTLFNAVKQLDEKVKELEEANADLLRVS